MKFGYTIIYVESVEQTLEFYRAAFGFEIRFLHESKDYGELDTGATVLAFASHELGELNLNGRYIKGGSETPPLGFELAFVTEEVQAAYERALSAGAQPMKAPEAKPWGQLVGYVRAIDGTVVELCSPVNG
ncbi:VOC family protein [Marinobacterium arenosum]|uniref:VOC family protein n=1 Tax=Marinobacterium arenosum TaxID=2862496 RepID=UPI0021072C43|nr:VOC family protein [Marinobacterium arenosum]